MVVVAVFLEPRVFFRISRYRGGANQPDTKVYIIYLIRRYDTDATLAALLSLVYFEYVLRPRQRIHGVG